MENTPLWQLSTGEQLTKEQLVYWSETTLEDYMVIDYRTESYSNVDHGIQIVFRVSEDSRTLDYRAYLSPRSRSAIDSAKDTYYEYFVVDQLIAKNKERTRLGKLKARGLKMSSMKLVRRINR